MPLLCIQHSKLSDIGCHRHKSCLTSIPVVYTCFLLMFVHLSLMSFETLQENRLERDLHIRCPTVGFKSSGDDTSISLFVIHSCLIANNKGAVGWSWEQCGFDHNCWRLVKVSHQLPVPAQRPVLATLLVTKLIASDRRVLIALSYSTSMIHMKCRGPPMI
jgi:hypothetical protein